VPLDERYGTPLRLFTIWISIQLSIVCATLNAMIYLLVPWSAINLADYYVVRKGEYVIAEFFRREGRYGAFQWRTIAVYVFGIAVQVPFMSLLFFKGMIAQAIGADLAWLPGLAVPAVLYVIVARRSRHHV
jgi:NCS1 family nucleobase:cation symporter-1